MQICICRSPIAAHTHTYARICLYGWHRANYFLADIFSMCRAAIVVETVGRCRRRHQRGHTGVQRRRTI